MSDLFSQTIDCVCGERTNDVCVIHYKRDDDINWHSFGPRCAHHVDTFKKRRGMIRFMGLRYCTYVFLFSSGEKLFYYGWRGRFYFAEIDPNTPRYLYQTK